MAEWIKAGDSLPENGQVVLAVMKKKNTVSNVDVVQFHKDEIDGTYHWRAPYCLYWQVEVTHWMALPALPKS